ncbi:MAG: hypothetical protein GY771_05160 [bacterium]|nr:hypothetical protein [bacterium]
MDNESHILITDIGSTTTKGLLIGVNNGDCGFVADVEVPTTVEKPNEDVKIGVREVCRALGKKAGLELLDADGEVAIPYFSTSSAGGGLQILVFGLSSTDTGRVAKMAAYGSGGIILETFTIDDGVPAVEKIRLIRELHPDIILMAGGIDGGAISGVVRLAEVLSISDPTPKFRTSKKIPLVFCGNVEARPYVEQILDDVFDIHIIDNLRPDLLTTNIAPAKEKIHDLFMSNVMERAPGYDKLRGWCKDAIIPTPEGIENILRLYKEEYGRNVLIVDMGGATTDIFTNIAGEYSRTVAANIGMSYSLTNILAECGLEKITRHLPDTYSEDNVRDYIANKTLNPTYRPKYESEKRTEQAAAIEGISFAWELHKKLNFEYAKIGFLDKRKLAKNFDPFEQVYRRNNDENTFFQLSDIDLVIGAGGVLSNAERETDILWILADAFKPSGITKIAVDRVFKSPHMGVLSNTNPELALEMFESECLEDIGYVVAPTGKVRAGRRAMAARDEKKGEEYVVEGGQAIYLPEGGELTFDVEPKLSLPGCNEAALTTELPVLIDCRGRGENSVVRPLTDSNIEEFYFPAGVFATDVKHEAAEIYRGEYAFERKLPHEGKVFVEVGDAVKPDTVIGENRYAPPRIYIIDLNKRIGYDKKFKSEDFDEGILVKEGDAVTMGQRLFKTPIGLLGFGFYFDSPVRGRVIRIEPNGIIIMREIQDYDDRPKTLDVAKELGVKPRHLRGHLKYDVGDFVEKGQVMVKPTGKSYDVGRSPATGVITEINTETGTVTVQYDTTPVPLYAFVNGVVTEVKKNLSATISGNGTMLYGAIGFGSENNGAIEIVNGTLLTDKDVEGKTLVSFDPIDRGFLVIAKDNGANGVIAPSLYNRDWVAFYGGELGVIVTGDEDIPFTLVLTEGFGRIEMNADYRSLLKKNKGKMASLSGRTQIRAGVTRPTVILSE